MTWRQSWYGGATARPMWAMKAQQKMTDRKTGTRSCRSWSDRCVQKVALLLMNHN